MNLREVRYLPEARLDLFEISIWYEGKSIGLGADFFRCVEAVESQLSQYPESFPMFSPPYRRARVRRFPYGLYYRLENEVVYVVTVLHLKRGEKSIGKRLS